MNEVRKSVQDAAYTAVGVGVLGAQQAAQLTQQAVDAAKSQVGESRTTATTAARSTADDAKDRVEDLVHDVRERVEPVVAKVAERVEPFVSDVWGRIEPALEQLQVKADEVVAAGTAKARAILGRDTTTESRAA